VWKNSRCLSFTRARSCAKAVLESLLGRRGQERSEELVMMTYALGAFNTRVL
jgi:hypothetical protein